LYKRVNRQLDRAQKAVEREIEANDARKRALAQKCEEWKQAYLGNHELGQKTGAWKLPLWWVVLKICAVPLLVLVFCMLVDPIVARYILADGMRWLLYGCLTLGLGVLYAGHAIRAWERPTPKELYHHKATIFRTGRETEPKSVVVVPPSVADGNGYSPKESRAGVSEARA
jgi:hypothetical protein